ncbi:MULTISPECIES: helix-turn-helix domain-containing protein [Bhargavaea]|uniref:Helix-turn-helix domain-containing protein n=1 Tax=Bhargavaea changchunensis TaxID=2134037 RepID=A0ABW2NH36_9BACL|nr:tetratricopeptide repeat protein [Bhargavaea sp. CC-171006]
MEVGERLRQIRIHKGFTQSELVEGICSVTYISRIEGGKAKPSGRFIKEVANKLGVLPSLILEPDNDRDEQEVGKLYESYKSGQPLDHSEVSFLGMTALENHSPKTFFQIYTMLIEYASAQENPVTDVEEYVRRSENLLPDEPEPQHAEIALDYYRALSRFYYSRQQFEKAYRYEKIIEKHLDDNSPGIDHARNFFNLALSRTQLDDDTDLELALHYGKQALELFLQSDHQRGVADCLTTLSIITHRMGDYEDALHYLDQLDDQTLGYLTELDQSTDGHATLSKRAVIDYNYGRIYQKMGDSAQARTYFKKSLELDTLAENEKFTTPVLTRLAELYAEQKNWERTEYYLNRAFDVAERYDLPGSKVLLLHKQAHLHKVKGDEPAYEKEMQKAIQLASDWNFIVDVKEISTELADHYYEVRAYKMAAKYYRFALERD